MDSLGGRRYACAVRGVLPFALALAACSPTPIDAGKAVIVQGPDDDAWTRAPAPTRVRVEKIAAGGDASLMLEADAPVSEFSLGLGNAVELSLTATSDDGVVRVRGRSLPVNPPGFAGHTLPLFVSRAGAFSRARGELGVAPGSAPRAALVSGRFLLVASGESGASVETASYDLASWSAVGGPTLGCKSPPCSIRSLAIVDDTLGLAVGDDAAIWFELADGSSGDVTPPSGLSGFDQIAGGLTVDADDGSAYVVGATRAAGESDVVLRVSATGELTAIHLTAPRTRAAACWVEGRGLVVVGGSDTAAGAELLAAGADSFVPLAFPPDATEGAALAALDSTTVVRIGGAADSVSLDLGCGTSCAPAAWSEPVALDAAQGFSLSNGSVLAVGQAQGATRAYLMSESSAQELPLREPRSNGIAVALPTGHVAVVGGSVSGEPTRSIELFAEP